MRVKGLNSEGPNSEDKELEADLPVSSQHPDTPTAPNSSSVEDDAGAVNKSQAVNMQEHPNGGWAIAITAVIHVNQNNKVALSRR